MEDPISTHSRIFIHQSTIANLAKARTEVKTVTAVC